MRELIEATLDWATNKNIIDPTKGAERQCLKAMSELGELADEILKGDYEKQVMEMGDVIVTLICTGAQLGIDIEDALYAAFTKINARTGNTVDGVFIKD